MPISFTNFLSSLYYLPILFLQSDVAREQWFGMYCSGLGFPQRWCLHHEFDVEDR
jgi:hypothetical protein